VFFANMIWSRFRGQPATANPWEAASLEWTTDSPAPHLNWEVVPHVYRGPYEYRLNGEPDGYKKQVEPLSAEEMVQV